MLKRLVLILGGGGVWVVDIVRNSIAGNNLIEIRVNVFVTEKEINGPFSE